MTDVFRMAVEAATRTNGLHGLATVWARTLRDLLRTLPGPVQQSRGTGSGGWLEDFAYAWRSLAREPRFTFAVTVVLALGIAVNVAAFAVLNAYLLRPLPFPDADQIVSVGGNGDAVSWTEVDAIFERAVSWDLDVFTIVGDGRAEMASGAWVTPDFLDTYGIEPALGRGFRPEEAGRTGAPVALISHGLWQRRFGGDADIIGRSFAAYTADRPDHAESFTIVGVLPSDFWYFNDYTDVLVPIRVERAVYTGRLREGVTLEQAETELTRLARARLETTPENFRVALTPLQQQQTASVRPTLLALQVAVLLVLLIACANASVLVMLRSTRREQEISVRRALGASTGRLARQLLVEGATVAVAAASMGVGVALLGLGVLRRSAEAQLGSAVPGGADMLTIDTTVAGATLLLTLGVGVPFGTVPLLSLLRRTGAIGRRGSTESVARRRVRGAMVAMEVALSLALLTGAGLMVRSALHLQNRDLGFDPAGVAQGVMGLRDARYPTPADRVATFVRLADRLEAVPGVEAVGLSSMGLFTTRFNPRILESDAGTPTASAPAVRWTVDERFVDAIGADIEAGRGFRAEDAAGSEPVVLVSRALARSLWGNLDPVGHRVRWVPESDMTGSTPPPGPWHRVVGVVADIQREVGGTGAGDAYLPMRQSEVRYMNALVRFAPGVPPATVTLSDAVADIDSEIPFASPRQLDTVVARAMQPTRYVAALLTLFSAFALVLSLVGLYAVVSYAARAHQRDVAIRVALGAGRGRVTAMFLRQGMLMVGIGVGAGALGGRALARALAGQLHGVSPGDPQTHVAISVLLLTTALGAVWIPSRRAARSDPMSILREE